MVVAPATAEAPLLLDVAAPSLPVALPADAAAPPGPPSGAPPGPPSTARKTAARPGPADGDGLRVPADKQRVALGPPDPAASGPLLDISALSVTYGRGRRAHVALEGVSFTVQPGEVLGIVGESGSGKSTLARTVVGLLSPSAGEVRLKGAPLAPSCEARPAAVLQAIQIVFQNPDASLNPRQTVRGLLDHPLKKFMGHLSAGERGERRAEVVERLRLPTRVEERYPRELSGGQRQRVALARALVAEPVLLLCDEVTSALDVSVQASILELLRELTQLYSLTMLFVTHDLGVLRSIASRVVVLESGRSGRRARLVRSSPLRNTLTPRPSSPRSRTRRRPWPPAAEPAGPRK